MFVHRRSFFKGLVAISLLFALIGAQGCGGDPAAQPATAPGAEPAPAPDDPAFADADPTDVQVIKGWVDTLSSGDVEGAAAFFAIPSVAENGTTLQIRSTADAILFNRSLPCGAVLTTAETTGAFTSATFRLTERSGGNCGAGVGGIASTSFVIEDGKITEWRRVDTSPPDGGTGEAV